jgi:hypothetical protein
MERFDADQSTAFKQNMHAIIVPKKLFRFE